MNEPIFEVEAAFTDIFDACSPPTHDNMSVAFKRSNVDSPRETETGAINKRRRISAAFEDAASRGEEATDSLIVNLARELKRARVYMYPSEEQREYITDLRNALSRAGWHLDDEGSISKQEHVLVQTGGRDALDQQIRRLRNAGDDIGMTLGAAKDALEAAAKYVIQEHGESAGPSEALEPLVNRSLNLLNFPKKPVDSSNTAEGIIHIRQAIVSSAAAIRLLRNDHGSGHGRTSMAAVTPADAIFVKNQALTIINYILAKQDGAP